MYEDSLTEYTNQTQEEQRRAASFWVTSNTTRIRKSWYTVDEPLVVDGYCLLIQACWVDPTRVDSLASDKERNTTYPAIEGGTSIDKSTLDELADAGGGAWLYEYSWVRGTKCG